MHHKHIATVKTLHADKDNTVAIDLLVTCSTVLSPCFITRSEIKSLKPRTHQNLSLTLNPKRSVFTTIDDKKATQ